MASFRSIVAACVLSVASLQAAPALASTSHGLEAIVSGASIQVLPGATRAWALRLDVEEPGTEVQVESRDEGLALSFEVLAQPEGKVAPLAISLRFSGDPTAKLAEQGSLDFFVRGTRILRYGILRVLDAAGLDVPAHLETRGEDVFGIVLERVGAFPMRVETVLASAKGPRPYDAPQPTFASPEAAPANDLCGGALTINPAGPFPFTTALADINDATIQGDPPARPPCAFPSAVLSRSVWYRFTPATAGQYSFSTCSDSGTTVDDTVLAVYTSDNACAGTFTQVAGGCDDDGCDSDALQSYLVLTLAANTTYYAVVWNQGNPPTLGNRAVALRVGLASVPTNDTCAGAATIPAAGPFPYLTSTTADITSATTDADPPVPSCKPNGTSLTRSTWYSFTPASTGIYRISSCAIDEGGTATTVDDTLLALYTSAAGCTGPFSEIPTSGTSDGCDDDTCGTEGLQGIVTTRLVADTTYFVLVYKVGDVPPTPNNSAVQLRFDAIVQPGNDRCEGAIPVALDAPLYGTTVGAFDDYRAPATADCFSGIGQPTATNITTEGGEVAYTFLVPTSDLYSFRATGIASTSNLVVYVASDCPAPGTPPPDPPPTPTVACLRGSNRNRSLTAEEVSCLSLRGGTRVYVYVDEATASNGSPFTLEVNRCRTELEFNDTPAAANFLQCGLEGGISIPPSVDFDYFTLLTPAAGSRVFALVDGSAGDTTDFDLRINDATATTTNTLEYDDFNADIAFGSLSPTCDGTPLAGTPSYLRINAFFAGQIAEPYRIYSVVQPPLASAVAETEPNDVVPTSATSPNGYFKGTLSSSSDVDLYPLDATTGDLIFLGLDGAPVRDESPQTPFDGRLSLLDAAGTNLITVDDPDSSFVATLGTGMESAFSPRFPGEALAWRARTTGTYYAKVERGVAPAAPATGDYLLSISINCERLGVDSDEDGVPDIRDCASADATAFARPSEVASLTLGPGSVLSWTAAGGGSSTRYDVLRGPLDALPVGTEETSETCFTDLTATTMTDSVNPSQGQGFWYVVRGYNRCALGIYGSEGANGVTTLERDSTTCQ